MRPQFHSTTSTTTSTTTTTQRHSNHQRQRLLLPVSFLCSKLPLYAMFALLVVASRSTTMRTTAFVRIATTTTSRTATTTTATTATRAAFTTRTTNRRTLTRSTTALFSDASTPPPPWLKQQFENDEEDSGIPKSKDFSATSKSRAPFSMPKSSPDDSVTTGSGGNSKDGYLAWSSLGLLTELVDSVCVRQGLKAPTPVQQMVIPELLKEQSSLQKKNHVAFLAATGSGKTLAYALPLMQQMKTRELFSNSTTSMSNGTVPVSAMHAVQRKPKRPRVVILAPTRELAVQITSVVKLLSHSIKLSSQCLVGGEDYGKQRKGLDRPIDILVATPGRLLKHWTASNVFLGDVEHVVLDEMDTMLEQGFQQDLKQILHPLLYKKKNTDGMDAAAITSMEVVEGAPRVILTSATMTQAVAKLIGIAKDDIASVGAKRHYVKQQDLSNTTTTKTANANAGGSVKTSSSAIVLPKMKVIKAPGLHKAVPRLQQVFVDCGNVDKLSLLVDVVHTGGGRGAAVRAKDNGGGLTIVFCNTVASCRAAEHALTEAGLSSFSYHGDMNSQARAESLKQFRQQGQSEDNKDDDDDEDAKEASILVCTDLAARGLDVPEVDHVVMFDFPLNSLDYLHRSGRTARGVNEGERKGNGRVTALVTKRDKVLAAAIEQAVQRGEPLDGLSSRKSDYIPNRRTGSSTLGARLGGGSSGGRNSRSSNKKSGNGDRPTGRRGSAASKREQERTDKRRR